MAALVAATGAGMLCGGAAWADSAPNGGSSGDGSLQLNPDVITNSSISAGGTSEFPGVSELFLPVMAQRAKDNAALAAKQTDVGGALSFVAHPDPAFAYDYSGIRMGLFAGYQPSVIPAPSGNATGSSETYWLLGLGAAALPMAGAGVWLGRRRASRRWSRHDSHAY